MQDSIQLKNISVSSQDKIILHNLSATFSSLENNVIVGPSGSGKSTLLRSIAGLIKPNSGEITQISSFGYVLQEGGLFSHLNVAKNISISGQINSWTEKKKKERIDRLCDLFRFPQDLLLRYPSQLSGGQRQRVSLMRAFFLDPELILMDEPFTGLDQVLKYEIIIELKQLVSLLNKTLIFVTHDYAEASSLADKITYLSQGQILFSGSFKEFSQTSNPEIKKWIKAFQVNLSL